MTSTSALHRAFGQRLKQLRKARGWTQEELGRRTERHWTYIGGLERGERNPTLSVLVDLAAALGARVADLLEDRHPVCGELNASAENIMDALAMGFRARIDVKGKLAELFLARKFEDLRAAGRIQGFTWHDADGRPDFDVNYRKRRLVVECKNIRNEAYRNPPAYKVELQKTRNSMDGTPTRGYKVDEFDVLSVALFNQTGRWEYLFVATRQLERRPNLPRLLVVMQRVPMAPSPPWTTNPLEAFDDALSDR